MSFKVCQCPKCGNIQATQSEKTFKCFRCSKSTTINPKSKLGRGLKILKTFPDGNQAARFIIELTKLKHQKKED
ncbi:hypothetical protein GF371_03995 [Candidatus Woesearchaeota archaeon]|nr:hypothetical protein [Candidatus Woesearchaeota archaeon]